MAKEWFTVGMSNKGVPVIKVIGYIGPYDEVNYRDFDRAFEEIASNHPECILKINSGGGSTVEGFAIYDMIRQSKCKVHVQTVGMAASMGIILAICGASHKMAKNATGMTHKPTGGAWGESSKLISMAKLIDQMEDKAIAAFVAKTGQKEEVVKSWFQPGVDNWLTAKECIDLGIADGYIEGDEEDVNDSIKPPSNFASQEDAWKVYNVINNQPNKQMKKIIAVLSALNIAHTLTENSTDEQVAAVIDAAMNKDRQRIGELENSTKTELAARVKADVQVAKDDGRITADEEQSTTALLMANYTVGKAMLDKLPKRADVNASLNREKKDGPSASSEAGEDRKNWSYNDWSKNDPAGLAELETKNPEAFKRLEEGAVASARKNYTIGDGK